MWIIKSKGGKYFSEKCAICLDLIQKPRTLHCGHSFCGSCIGTYISIFDKANVKCPLCRKYIFGSQPFFIFRRGVLTIVAFSLFCTAGLYYAYGNNCCFSKQIDQIQRSFGKWGQKFVESF